MFLNKQTFPKWMLCWGTSATFQPWLSLVAEHSSPNLFKLLHVLVLAYFRPHEFEDYSNHLCFSTFAHHATNWIFSRRLGLLSLRFEKYGVGAPIEACFSGIEILSTYIYNQFTSVRKSWFGISDTSRIDFSHERQISCRLERRSLGPGQFWKTELSWESSSLLGAYGWPLTCSKSALKPSTMEITLPSFYSGPLALFCFSDCWDNQPTLDLPPSVVVCAWLPLVPKRLLDAKESQGPSADKLSKRRTKKHASLRRTSFQRNKYRLI